MPGMAYVLVVPRATPNVTLSSDGPSSGPTSCAAASAFTSAGGGDVAVVTAAGEGLGRDLGESSP